MNPRPHTVHLRNKIVKCDISIQRLGNTRKDIKDGKSLYVWILGSMIYEGDIDQNEILMSDTFEDYHETLSMGI